MRPYGFYFDNAVTDYERNEPMSVSETRVVAVVGLGYVGLPLAIELGKRYRTIGFDLSVAKIESYRRRIDPTGEISVDEFAASAGLELVAEPEALAVADFLIVAVPTPVDAARQPDFSALIGASTTVGRHMKRGAIVVYESTVYPGATEEICIPVLERCSGMKWKEGFHVGYSPERINPGDKEHTLTTILKVVSGDTPQTLDAVAQLYGSIVTAGTYRAASIKVAEAAKVIENTQRDLNIALMNELSIVFHKMDIDTSAVLEAAGTKWNFLKFKPGLVGGHCIGVDPYYLTHKAEKLGYHPDVILAGRRINDGMAKYIAEQTVKQMIQAGSGVKDAKVIVLGLTFKENCPDLRNSKVADLVCELQDFGCEVFVHDPIASSAEALHEYGVELTTWGDLPASSEAVVLAVAHRQYCDMGLEALLTKAKPGAVFVDVKSAHDAETVKRYGMRGWRL